MSANQPQPDIALLHVSHDMGGGIRLHIEQLQQLLSGTVQIVTLASQPGNYMKLSAGSRDWYFHQHDQFQDLLDLLRALSVAGVHFHHFSGLPPHCWQLPRELAVPYRITLHDFFLINGVTTLCDDEGFFLEDFASQGNPRFARLPSWCPDLAQWQAMNAALLASAEWVLCPSSFVLETYRAHFPDPCYRQCYHPDWERDAPYPAVKPAQAGTGKLRVAVLGMLSREKGADRLDQLAMAVQDSSIELEFVLVGKAYRRLHDSVKTLGPYSDHQLAEILADQAVDLVWFPALCAESYSYTLSQCLRQGLPVLAPDIGAFPERLAGRPLSFLYPYRASTQALLEQFALVRDELRAAGQAIAWRAQALPAQQQFLYSRDYLDGISAAPGTCRYDLGAFRQYAEVPTALKLAALKTSILRWLVQRSESRNMAFIQKLLPYGVQKRLKRLLSHKPLHELGS